MPDNVKQPVSPWNPSRRATARVTNPLPAPTTCPNCGGVVELVNNQEIYGRPYGEWPWAYRCADLVCNSYVGLHPFTGIPLGTLANAPMRVARKDAKALFNPIWQGKKRKTRSEAYAWLSRQMGIPTERCHIGWFNVEQCEKVVRICRAYLFSKPSRSE